MLTFNTIEDFTKYVNKERLNHKNKWFYIQCIVNGSFTAIKGFNTWLQIFKHNGVNYSNCMDRSVKDFKEDLLLPFKGVDHAL